MKHSRIFFIVLFSLVFTLTILAQEKYDKSKPTLEKGKIAIKVKEGREVVVVADSSKFQRRSLSVIAKLDAVHKVITDSGTSPEVLAALRARNVEVVVV